jgi:hypothetical protein
MTKPFIFSRSSDEQRGFFLCFFLFFIIPRITRKLYLKKNRKLALAFHNKMTSKSELYFSRPATTRRADNGRGKKTNLLLFRFMLM